MNILDTYLIQKSKLTIVFSCIDNQLLEDVIENLNRDLKGEIRNITKFFKNFNQEEVEKFIGNNPITFILAPFYPDKLLRIRVNYHIKLSLNYKLRSTRNLDSKILGMEKKMSENNFINKFVNIKEINIDEIANKLFDIIMSFLKKKLDDGKYLDRISNLDESKDNNSFYSSSDDDSPRLQEIFDELEESSEDLLGGDGIIGNRKLLKMIDLKKYNNIHTRKINI